jgi:hypothetical protein
MAKFKHSKEVAKLQGFEKRFYDAIEEVGLIICEVTEAKPKEMLFEYAEADEKTLTVTLTIDTETSSMSREVVWRFGTILCQHFPAFFTPSHYRKYDSLNFVRNVGDDDCPFILGSYSGGV